MEFSHLSPTSNCVFLPSFVARRDRAGKVSETLALFINDMKYMFLIILIYFFNLVYVLEGTHILHTFGHSYILNMRTFG